MATTGTTGTAASALPAAGGTSTSGLADWAAPYITNYLGKAQALGDTPYQTYQGPLTAGPSDIQNKVFQGIGNLTFPSNLGQSFASPMGGMSSINSMPSPGFGNLPPGNMGAIRGTPDYGNLSIEEIIAQSGGNTLGGMPPYAAMGMGPVAQTEEMRNMARQLDHSDYPMVQRPQFSGGMSALTNPNTPGGIGGLQPPQTSMQPSSIAQSYMNPYLQAVLDPQMAELRRQNDITNMNTNARLTQAGAFGGSRQAIMNAENNRNLMQEMNKTVGQGYANAFDKAMGQFNTEQGQSRDLAKLMSDIGGIQRGITSEGIAADVAEFDKQREFPYKQLQFQRDMISGLPTGSVTNTPSQLSGIAQLFASVGGVDKFLKDTGIGDLKTALGKLGLDFGG